MLQRYKKKSHICKFSLTKCATFFVRRYEGTFFSTLALQSDFFVLYVVKDYSTLVIALTTISFTPHWWFVSWVAYFQAM